MRILFIRHAEAVDAESFEGSDLERPLTADGRRKAAAAYRRLFDAVPKPELIISSEALRAQQTAALLKVRAKRGHSEHLNPGQGVQGFRRLFRSLRAQPKTLAVVGHEPDLSNIVSTIVADGRLRLRLKKGTCVDVEVGPDGHGTLRAVLPLSCWKRK